jgi:hypothetical protein
MEGAALAELVLQVVKAKLAYDEAVEARERAHKTVDERRAVLQSWAKDPAAFGIESPNGTRAVSIDGRVYIIEAFGSGEGGHVTVREVAVLR